VPLYFAVVGLRLDLVGSFEPWFFLFLLGFACLVKSVSCYVGARLVGEGRSGARNLAVALNARGGPGIVLASVALDARIIDDSFYTMLVMLAPGHLGDRRQLAGGGPQAGQGPALR
jgi:Kef-type K+ transport system membrane component KefB